MEFLVIPGHGSGCAVLVKLREDANMADALLFLGIAEGPQHAEGKIAEFVAGLFALNGIYG